MDDAKLLTIGNLAAAAEVNVETIRYYQRLALIKEPPKPVQGYRQYPAEYILRVRFIKHCQQLGFTLREIQELLDLGDGQCQEVQQLTTKKIETIDERISDLKAMSSALKDLLAQCQSNAVDDTRCSLIETLVKKTDQAAS